MTYAQNQPTYPASLSGLLAAARDGVALTVVWKSATCKLTDEQIKAVDAAEPDQRYVITQWEHGGMKA